MIRQRSCFCIVLSSFLIAFGGLAVQALERKSVYRPIVSKIYPNPTTNGATLYLEGKHLVAPESALKAPTSGDNRLREGTYVEFTTSYGIKRVPAKLILNPPIKDVQVCSVVIPKMAISGPVKIITVSRADGRPIGLMSAAVNLAILQESAVRKAPEGWSRSAFSLLKEVPKKMLKDAFYYQTERAARRAGDAFARRETLHRLDTQYDPTRAGLFNSLPQIGYASSLGGVRRNEEWARQPAKPTLAAHLLAKPTSADQIPFYTLSNLGTMQKDIQEDLYNYAKPLFERLTHVKLEPDPAPKKPGFTRPQARFVYSPGFSMKSYAGSYSGLTRKVGFRVDFDYIRMNPLSEQMRKVLSFSFGADTRRLDLGQGSEQRVLMLIRFR